MRSNHRSLSSLLSRGSLLVPVLLSVLLVSSCSDQEFGIFYFLENETKQEDNSLENTLTVAGMLLSGSRYYIAGGGGMYSRTLSSTEWDDVRMPSGADYVISLSGFSVDGKMYAGFLMDDASYRFYRADPDRNPSWERITTSVVDGPQIMAIEELNGRLFVATYDDEDYGLYSSGDGTGYTTEIAPQSNRIFDVAFDGGDYWVAAGEEVYTGGSGALATKPSGELPDKNGGYTGVYHSTDYGKWYIAMDNGVVADSSNGTSWSESDSQSVAGKDVPFRRITEIPNPENNILVATEGYGFYEMEDGQADSLERMSEFTAVELFKSWVLDIFIDAPTVFCLTAGSGLWRNTYESGTWGDWVWE